MNLSSDLIRRKNRKHAGQRQGTQVIPLSLPSVRLRQRENVPDEAPLSAESRKRIPIWIWTVILTKKRK